MAGSLKGFIEKKPSVMMTAAINRENIINPEFVYYNLKNSVDFKTLDMYFDSKSKCPGIRVRYRGRVYNITFSIEQIFIPEGYSLTNRMSPENIAALKNAKTGITTRMFFGEDMTQSYFLQLKVLNCMVPDSAGVIDFSAEKIYSPVWVSMACQASVPPSADSMFSLHAVGDKNDEKSGIWLHTHGLGRCGLIELEIPGCSIENYARQSMVLNAMASNAIIKGYIPDEFEPVFLARLGDGSPVYNTWVDFKKGLKLYENYITGAMKDRKKAHNKNFGIVFNYPSQEDYRNKKLVKLTQSRLFAEDNPLFLLTKEETERMSVLARERYNFLKDYYNKWEEALVKARLKVDEDMAQAAGFEYEHIWFEIKEINEDKLKVILTQEPYYVSCHHTGDEMEIEKESITDWKMFFDGREINPDNCYLLVEGIIKA